VLAGPTAVLAQQPGREHYNAARRHLDAGRVDSAEAALRRAMQAGPRESLYPYHLGALVLVRTGRYAEAIEAFTEAWEKGARDGVTRFQIGRALHQLGRHDEAAVEYERALAWNREALARAAGDQAAHLRYQVAEFSIWLARLRMAQGDGEAAYRLAADALGHDDRREHRGGVFGLGHTPFGDGDYGLAARFYALSLRDRTTGEPLRDVAWDWFPDWRIRTDELLEVVENRRRLGTVAPADTHRIMAVVIRDQEVETEVEGRRARIHHVITDRQRREAESRLRWLRQMVESLSDGRFSLAYRIVDDTTRYRYEGETRPAWIPDRRLLAGDINEFDTLVRLWPYGEGEGTGGATSLSLEPVSATRVTRGIINIHPEFSHGMWLHEFFHVVEAMAGIQPTHGYYDEPRRQFPAWTGPKNSQLSYFRWHFSTTLPRVGWGKLNFRLRYPVAATR
jgi:tetratricopeptide (TPR) repeat protein